MSEAELKKHGQTRPGWSSTKLHMALITQALITLAYGLMGWPQLLFGEFCTALLAAASIFSAPALMENLKRLKNATPPAPPAP